MRGILYSRFMWEAHCVVAPLTVARYTLSIFRSLPVGCRLAILVSGWGYKKEGEEPKSPPPKTKEKKGGGCPPPRSSAHLSQQSLSLSIHLNHLNHLRLLRNPLRPLLSLPNRHLPIVPLHEILTSLITRPRRRHLLLATSNPLRQPVKPSIMPRHKPTLRLTTTPTPAAVDHLALERPAKRNLRSSIQTLHSTEQVGHGHDLIGHNPHIVISKKKSHRLQQEAATTTTSVIFLWHLDTPGEFRARPATRGAAISGSPFPILWHPEPTRQFRVPLLPPEQPGIPPPHAPATR